MVTVSQELVWFFFSFFGGGGGGGGGGEGGGRGIDIIHNLEEVS